jgi:ABC-type transporter Mla maintaining outer membrane lipid asymmetry ATPase subunit MlaF
MSVLESIPAAGGPVIEMIDVTIGSLAAPEQPVIEGVQWTVGPGDYWAIGGLQASGKSDLLATVAGLVPPLRGTYRLFGRELVTGLEHPLLEARLALGLVFESGRLLNHLTVVENVSLPLRYHQNLGLAEAISAMGELLEWLGLSRQAAHLPGAIGRNLQRRVGLARALVLKPKILLVDNPLSGLDPREAAWWLHVLDQLAAGHPLLDSQPLTLVVTGADLRPWRARARSFGILKERRFVGLGTRQELETHGEPMLEELLKSGGA